MEEKKPFEGEIEEVEISSEENPVYQADSKKTQNLISAVILLAGLFAGSLFVDVAQLVRRNGFSERSLTQTDLFESGGKTWVAYAEPIVKVSVINDETCEKCNSSEALIWLRRVMPTMKAEEISFDSPEGKSIIEKYGIKTLPAFVFSDAVSKTDFFSQAQVLFEKEENEYVLKTQELGLAPGKYLELPKVDEKTSSFGNSDSKVRVVVFSDFQCPYCKSFWKTLRESMKKNAEKAFFAYKHFPLSFHPQANNAALAAECAAEQKKFWEYGDKLFDSQQDWASSTGVQKFKDYARSMGLNASQFNKCLDEQKYQDIIVSDGEEAGNFGIAGTPGTFINSDFKSGVISEEELESAINDELAK